MAVEFWMQRTSPTIGPAAPRSLCTDCGISRTADPKRCGRACQFIHPDYAGLETRVHGRARDPARADETHFGPFRRTLRARLAPPSPGAQWTGITTRIGERLLETGAVDAVLTMGADPDDRWRPVPILVTEAAGMAQARGMRMGYAPLLALLEPAIARGVRRLAVIGIPCQVYALRALEQELGLDALYVIGTPCSDNTTTERFHGFLALLSDQPERITYLEFRADYHVELRFDDGRRQAIPFLKLPLSRLPADFFPLTCQTCVDYTNALSDLTVGYMAGEGEQWLLVRNERGEQLLALVAEAEAMLHRDAGAGVDLGTVVLDPGHGGAVKLPGSSPNNATSVSGVLEKTLTLDFGLVLRDALVAQAARAGETIKVVMTRDRDVNVAGAERAGVAGKTGARAFLSLHFNGAGDATVRGTETFYRAAENGAVNLGPDIAFARAVQSGLLAGLRAIDAGAKDRGTKPDTQSGPGGLGVLNPRSLGNAGHARPCVAALAEIEFITHPAVDRLIVSGAEAVAHRQAVAAPLADAIRRYLRG